jgi:hypothetical protein
MNQLINDIFGDGYITLQCDGGECLHYSQVPGYVVSRYISNTEFFLSFGLPLGPTQTR